MSMFVLTRDQGTLLLYLESRLVDQDGVLDNRHLNSDDNNQLEEWNLSGFVGIGRLPSELCSGNRSQWCVLSIAAIMQAARLREERALRSMNRFLKRLEGCETSQVQKHAVEFIRSIT